MDGQILPGAAMAESEHAVDFDVRFRPPEFRERAARQRVANRVDEPRAMFVNRLDGVRLLPERERAARLAVAELLAVPIAEVFDGHPEAGGAEAGGQDHAVAVADAAGRRLHPHALPRGQKPRECPGPTVPGEQFLRRHGHVGGVAAFLNLHRGLSVSVAG